MFILTLAVVLLNTSMDAYGALVNSKMEMLTRSLKLVMEIIEKGMI